MVRASSIQRWDLSLFKNFWGQRAAEAADAGRNIQLREPHEVPDPIDGAGCHQLRPGDFDA